MSEYIIFDHGQVDASFNTFQEVLDRLMTYYRKRDMSCIEVVNPSGNAACPNGLSEREHTQVSDMKALGIVLDHGDL